MPFILSRFRDGTRPGGESLHGRMNLPNAWLQMFCVETLIETHADEPQGS